MKARFRYGLLGLAVLVWVLVCVIVACEPSSQAQEEKTAIPTSYEALWGPEAQYVGSEACQSCHADIYNKYQLTGKGRSWYRPSQAQALEDFSAPAVYDPFLKLWYQAYWQDQNMWMKEFRLQGRDTVHILVKSVDWVVGSGNQTRSYVHEENGYYYEMPLTWYSKRKLWDLSPGYEKGQNSRFERAMGQQCIWCHHSGEVFAPESGNRFTQIGQAISCEKCHGPGSLHIAAQKAGQKVDTARQADYTILNPKRIPVSLQMDVCRQCHLEGVAVGKKGLKLVDFRPGRALSDYLEIFVPQAEGHEAYGFASHAERLQQSACFIKSAGKLTCTTCHNPHEPSPAEPASTYDATCQKCHTTGHEKICSRAAKAQGTSSCFGCHMPASGVTDIPHVNSHDHYIRVRKPGEKAPEAGSKIFAMRKMSSTGPAGTDSLRAWLEYFETISREPAHLLAVKSGLAQLPDYDQIRYAYLSRTVPAEGLLQTPPSQIRLAHQALMLGEIRQRVNMEFLSYLRRAVELAPDNLDYRLKLAVWLENSGAAPEASSQYQFILSRKPDHAKALVNLGYYFLLSRNYAEAEKLTRRACRTSPDYVLARENLVRILAESGKLQESQEVLQDLIARYPKKAEYKILLQRIRSL